MIRKEQMVARAAIYDEYSYIDNLTLEAIERTEADQFVKDVIGHLDRSRKWRTDLYSGRISYIFVYRALKRWLPVEIRRENYTMMTVERDSHFYEFVSVKQMTKENLLELMMSAGRTTPDLLLRRKYTSTRLYPAVQKQMEELLDDEESDILSQILLVEGQPASSVSMNHLLDDVGGIGYARVHADHQGKRLDSAPLQRAIDTAWHHDIRKLVGGIDTHNIAIRKSLI